ncbi:glucoamylase family protein [Leadbetterella sp. DM7]|uniref:glucoamylase family protein n=1 Tax=Leadbetterella sp. DM7 TaxID=3235085 RepID=UPI00349E800E
MKKGILFLALVFLCSCSSGTKEEPQPDPLEVRGIRLGSQPADEPATRIAVPLNAAITIDFSQPLDPAAGLTPFISLLNRKGETVACGYTFSNENRTLTLQPTGGLAGFQRYTFVVRSGLTSSEKGTLRKEESLFFYTDADRADKMERISDDALLTKVQQNTFRYFYDFAHPVSGMTRERSSTLNTVTTGGTGFGAMALCVGATHKFITRTEALAQLDKIVTFLENAEKYHGAFSHWYDGNTGRTQPFSAKDNGADLVETSFLMMGLLTAGEFLGDVGLNRRIDALYQAVEWSFFLNGTESLFWHWSPDYGFELNLKISGWNEALVAYVLAAGSERYAIEKNSYIKGWARNGAFLNGNLYQGIRLPLGADYGGPLFISQYSFLGINPFGLSDDYMTDYAVQCRNHTLINRAYCMENPNTFPGYGPYSWGLTASDNPTGYAAHSPRNDKGVISPTAALSSFPYTPEESMEALRFFYYTLGDKLWGDYGFKDAFSVKDDWYASDYIAIDQGPIIIGIENYRTKLLWTYGMKSPPVKNGLSKLGFRVI